jgi:hypothetical protein
MIALIVIILGLIIAYAADENGDMQGYGLGVATGALVVGAGSWWLG